MSDEVEGMVEGKGKMPSTKNGQSFEAQWHRLLSIFDIDTNANKTIQDDGLAKIFGKVRTTIQAARRKKEIPGTWLHEIANNFGVSVDYILTGSGSPRLDRQVADQPESTSEPIGKLHRKNEIGENDWTSYTSGKFKISDALMMATRVLESETSYALALYLNIQHFDRAIRAESRIIELEHKLSSMQSRMDTMQAQVEQLLKDRAAAKPAAAIDQQSGEAA